MSDTTDKPGSRKSRRSRRLRNRILIGVAILLVAALVGAAGWKGYKTLRQKRMVKQARAFIEKKELHQASLSLRHAIRLNPKDLTANRMMAELAEAYGDRRANETYWRRNVAELQPGVSENYLAWAKAAMRYNPPEVVEAELALSKVDEAGKQSSDYHEIAARIAVARGRPQDAASHVAEAAKLDPSNELYQLQLASVRLGSPLPEVRKQAFATIEQLATNPKVRRSALRTLLHGATLNRDGAKTLAFAEQLKNAPDALFEDRLLYLHLLHVMKRHEFWWYIAQLQAEPPVNPGNLASVFTWMNNHGLPQAALDWSKRLPEDVRTRVPVVLAVAEAYALLGDWKGIRPTLNFGKWGELDFQREALLARVAREEGNEPGFKAHWETAVTGAGDRPEAFAALLRFAKTWKWEREHTDLLWTMARGRTNAKPALLALMRQYAAQDKTKELLSVFAQQLELDPADIAAKNNFAYASLLLNENVNRASALAAEAYKADPSNGGYAATYAYSLHVSGKTNEALSILKSVNEKDTNIPSTALCYGVVLAASGAPDEAKKYLDRAEAGHLLPQEKALVAKTREKLTRL